MRAATSTILATAVGTFLSVTAPLVITGLLQAGEIRNTLVSITDRMDRFEDKFESYDNYSARIVLLEKQAVLHTELLHRMVKIETRSKTNTDRITEILRKLERMQQRGDGSWATVPP